MLKALHAKHWEHWLDSKIPALNRKTPRAAAKTKVGREQLEALFADFNSDNQSGRAQFPIDLDFLRKELNMTKA